MTTPTQKDTPTPEQQRDALADAQKQASQDQPRTYDERNETDKVVHINPPDPESDASIQGLDPTQ